MLTAVLTDCDYSVEQLSKKFFEKIMNNPNNPLFHLLLPPREVTIIG